MRTKVIAGVAALAVSLSGCATTDGWVNKALHRSVDQTPVIPAGVPSSAPSVVPTQQQQRVNLHTASNGEFILNVADHAQDYWTEKRAPNVHTMSTHMIPSSQQFGPNQFCSKRVEVETVTQCDGTLIYSDKQMSQLRSMGQTPAAIRVLFEVSRSILDTDPGVYVDPQLRDYQADCMSGAVTATIDHREDTKLLEDFALTPMYFTAPDKGIPALHSFLHGVDAELKGRPTWSVCSTYVPPPADGE